MATLMTSTSFNIPGPSPIGTIIYPASYTEFGMRGVTATVTNTVGQLNYVFTTNMRLDESKVGRVTSLNTPLLPVGFEFEYLPPTQTYQPLNTDGYNWQITTILYYKNAIGTTVDFPAGGIMDVSIDIEWDCKPK